MLHASHSVWNIISRYRRDKKKPTLTETSRYLTLVKKKTPSFKKIPRAVLQNILFYNYKCKIPVNKKDSQLSRLHFCSRDYSLDNGVLKISNISGNIKLKLTRPMPSKPTKMVVQKKIDGSFYAYFSCIIKPVKKTKIDQRWRTTIITLSPDDKLVKEIEMKLTRIDDRIKKMQKGVLKMKSGSINFKKKIKQLNKLLVKRDNVLSDMTHKYSSHALQTACNVYAPLSGLHSPLWNNIVKKIQYKQLLKGAMVIDNFKRDC
jgi:hypothetical protein